MSNDLIDSFYCSITGELMDDPVIDREGISYERVAIEEWIRLHQTSPITRSPLLLSHLTPNRALKEAITDALRRGVSLPTLRAGEPVGASAAVALPGRIADENMSQVQVILDIFPSSSDGSDFRLHANILSVERNVRIPSDIVVVIDTSGSMGSGATAQGVEDNGLTLLDMVKHAVKTIIHTLDSKDRLAIVKFSTGAKVVSPLLSMNEVNKSAMERQLEPLRPDGSTNIWEGIKMALDLLKNDHESAEIVSNSSILLLTDGESTINPPRGNLPMLQRYGELLGNKYPGIISTFGFGYSLDSTLLASMAELGGGMYAFIPDSGFVGTAFVHALANTLVTTTDNAVLTLEAMHDDVHFVKDKALNEEKHVFIGDKKVVINLGTLQAGQSIDIIKHLRITSSNGAISTGVAAVKASLSYTFNNQRSSQPASIVEAIGIIAPSNMHDLNKQYRFGAESFRLELVTVLKEMMKRFETSSVPSGGMYDTNTMPPALAENVIEHNLDAIRPLINTLRDKIQSWLHALPEPSIDDVDASFAYTMIRDGMLVDITGQITQAISRGVWFQRWGRHYLPSLCRAHELQQCNNFKDPGIQRYGGKVFSTVRDYADDAFGNLPPPTPSGNTSSQYQSAAYYGAPASYLSGVMQASAAPSATISMSSYNDRYGGCIHGSCQVLLADGQTTCRVDSLKPGDKLYHNTIVECIVRSMTRNGSMEFVKLADGLVITPWHPVRIDGQWIFPADLPSDERAIIACDYIYSFVLRYGGDDQLIHPHKRPSSMIIEGVDCICLGHGIEDDDVASHEFFGSEKIIDALRDQVDWKLGIITIEDGYRRDPSTGQVCCFL